MKIYCLTHLKPGQEGEVVSVKGGRRAIKRLADLGIFPGTEIKLLKKAPLWGPVEIEARSSRLVLGRGLASKVLIRPLSKRDNGE